MKGALLHRRKEHPTRLETSNRTASIHETAQHERGVTGTFNYKYSAPQLPDTHKVPAAGDLQPATCNNLPGRLPYLQGTCFAGCY